MSTENPSADAAPPTPRTTSVNEPTYAGAPAHAADLVAAAPPGESAVGRDPATQATLQRESSARYQLIAPPSYDNIVGGAAPSPIVSFFLVVGLAALLGAAVLMGLGLGGAEWWLAGIVSVVIATTLAGFISRTAG